MPLRTRLLSVTISLESGVSVTLDQSINLKVKIHKAALALQNSATIDVIGLTGGLRETLLSQFTAFNQRQVVTGQASQEWANVEIKAGWARQDSVSSQGNDQFVTQNLTTVFKGQVVTCDITSPPPNASFRLSCFTRQIDKTTYSTDTPPQTATLRELVKWAAGQMGFGNNYDLDSDKADTVITNPSTSIMTNAALLIDLQNQWKPDIAAFVDDDRLIVKDRNKILNPNAAAKVTQFVGMPTWTEWGVTFNTLFDQNIKLAGGANLTSLMNPSINQSYVILEIDYDLSSRDTPFYAKVSAAPPA